MGWTELPPPPQVRLGASTVWTGRFLVRWGGTVAPTRGGGAPESDGFMYDASLRTWSPTAASPLSAREGAAATWTGHEVLIWGGTNAAHQPIYDGAAYDPVSGIWRMLPPAPAQLQGLIGAKTGAAWTILGHPPGRDEFTAMAYNPNDDAWEMLPAPPINITAGNAVWTGDLLLVVGARLDGQNRSPTRTAIGAAYDFAKDRWTQLPPPALSPQAVTATWDGSRLVAWDYVLKSLSYDPSEARWTPLPNLPLDPAECYPSSAAVGQFVFGEYCGLHALFDGETATWKNVSRPDFRMLGFDVIAAEPVFLVVGHSVDSQTRVMFAYRPG